MLGGCWSCYEKQLYQKADNFKLSFYLYVSCTILNQMHLKKLHEGSRFLFMCLEWFEGILKKNLTSSV